MLLNPSLLQWAQRRCAVCDQARGVVEGEDTLGGLREEYTNTRVRM